jgi:hypothetical protein
LLPEPDEILKEKNDAIDPEDILSKKKDSKEQKHETQHQQAHHKTVAPEAPDSSSKLNPREWMAKALEANKLKEKEDDKTVTVAKDRVKTNMKGLMDKAVVEGENAQTKKSVSQEKEKAVAINTVKISSPKSIKR